VKTLTPKIPGKAPMENALPQKPPTLSKTNPNPSEA
jgi:hypothetical protein